MKLRNHPNPVCTSTWQWMTGPLLPHILFNILMLIIACGGSCEGFRKACWNPSILKDSSRVLQRRCPHRQNSYNLFTPTKSYSNHALSYSTASIDLFTSTTTTVSNLFPSVPPNTLLISEGFDPTGFFVNVLGGILNGPGILLVPIGAAVIVASTVAFLIISYSQPASPEEDTDDGAQNENEEF